MAPPQNRLDESLNAALSRPMFDETSESAPTVLSPEDLMRARAWAEVDLSSLVRNVREIQDRIQPARLLVVVKKDAYGHGLIAVTRALRSIGVRHFGVACTGEAVALRRAGIDSVIINVGLALPDEIESAIAKGIELTVATVDDARQVAQVARRLGRPARVHLKIDTGMGRLGLYPEQLMYQIDSIARIEGLDWVGLYSHLAACPDNADLTNQQLDRFRRVAEAMQEWLRIRHLGASGAIGDKRLHFDMVRVGIAAYGADPEQPEFEPAMTLKSRLVFIKDVPTGRSISYDATFVTKEPTRVGVVSIGYGNGYPRRISGRGYVVIDGRPAPILGMVCMDQLMVDLNAHPRAKVGDTVLLFGRDGDSCLPVWEVAEWAETISYEVLCTAGAMTPRLYLDSASPGGKSSTGGE